MLQTQTVEAGTLDLIKTLINDAVLLAFNLVGGTALPLLIGHLKSIDIDLLATIILMPNIWVLIYPALIMQMKSILLRMVFSAL